MEEEVEMSVAAYGHLGQMWSRFVLFQQCMKVGWSERTTAIMTGCRQCECQRWCGGVEDEIWVAGLAC